MKTRKSKLLPAEPPYYKHVSLENSKRLADGIAEKMKRMLNTHLGTGNSARREQNL